MFFSFLLKMFFFKIWNVSEYCKYGWFYLSKGMEVTILKRASARNSDFPPNARVERSANFRLVISPSGQVFRNSSVGIFWKLKKKYKKINFPSSFWTCDSVMPHFFWTMLQRSWYLLYFPVLWMMVAFLRATRTFCLAVVLADSGQKLSAILVKYFPGKCWEYLERPGRGRRSVSIWWIV